MHEGGEAIRELPEGTGDIGESEAQEVTTDGSQEISEDSGPESVRETVERVFKQSQEETAGDDSAGQEVPQKVPVREAKTEAPVQQKQDNFKIPAPARLSASQKELFNGLPDPLKRSVHDMFKHHEALLTRQNQQLHAEIVENQAIREAVRPYLQSHPELMQQGYTESKFMSALVAAHQRLTDPKTKLDTWLELGGNVGIPAETLEQLRGSLGQSGGTADISRHPEFVSLQQKLAALESKASSAEEQQFNSAVSGIVSEMEAVREEQDSNGRYLYPELHDDAFLQQVKPLVSALVGSSPGLGYGEALKRAYFAIKGQTGQPVQGNQARFPANNEQNIRAQQAAVSVRGRSAPVAPGDAEDIPPEALSSPRASVQWALNQLRRGA